MKNIKVKICGLTRKEDLLFSSSAGADAVGIVNVPSSKRFVTLEDAEKLFDLVPPFISKVLVASPENVEHAKKMEDVGIDYIQLHGHQEKNFIKELRAKLSVGLIKQVAVTGEETIELCREYSDYVDAILLDTQTKTCLGGTGKTHDWNISERIVKEVKKPIILAGGLNPNNVMEAIKKVNPYAVDVASGVETMPGIKDHRKIAEFIRKAKSL
jgi:phosphoribosylanthranilate isomerase